MPMLDPPHPGELVKYECLEALGLSVAKGAKVLGVTRPTLSKLINGKSAISTEMAIRLSKAFGSTPETWLKMQVAYDLAQARLQGEDKEINVSRYEPPSTEDPNQINMGF